MNITEKVQHFIHFMQEQNLSLKWPYFQYFLDCSEILKEEYIVEEVSVENVSVEKSL